MGGYVRCIKVSAIHTSWLKSYRWVFVSPGAYILSLLTSSRGVFLDDSFPVVSFSVYQDGRLRAPVSPFLFSFSFSFQ